MATYGGLAFPGVTRFMDGYYAGVQYYNKQKGKTVEVLGWDGSKPDPAKAGGTFVGGSGSTDTWNNPSKGEQIAKSFLDQGVDIVHPVAGETGNGSIKAMLAAGKWAIGVDNDQAITLPDSAGAILTSAQKAIDVSVLDVIKATSSGKMGGADYSGTLANNGVLLAPFHDFDSQIPAETKAGSRPSTTRSPRAASRSARSSAAAASRHGQPFRHSARPGRSGAGLRTFEGSMRLELATSRSGFPAYSRTTPISISADRGKVLGLLGENSAGKTTLMNILSGLYQPDSGQILIDGEERVFDNPHAAIHAGVGMVHQHFMLVPVFDVVEAVALGAETVTNRFGTFDRAAARKRIVGLSDQYKLGVNPDAQIEDLSVGVRQRVEILKALYRHSDILVLDEPSAVLTPLETEELFGIIRSLTAAGTTIIFITHKLNEVLEVADDVVVLRRGRVAGRADPKTATRQELANMMVGRDVELIVPKGPAKPAEVVLSLRDVRVRNDRLDLVVNGRRSRGARRRDRRHRGRPGQRADGARRGDRGPATVRQRRGDAITRHSHREGVAAPGLGPRRRRTSRRTGAGMA